MRTKIHILSIIVPLFFLLSFSLVLAGDCETVYGGDCRTGCFEGELGLSGKLGLAGCKADEYCCALTCDSKAVADKVGSQAKCVTKSNCVKQASQIFDCQDKLDCDGVCCTEEAARGCCVVNMDKPEYYGENNCIDNTTATLCQDMAKQTGSNASIFLSVPSGFDPACKNNTTYAKYCTSSNEQGCCVKDKTSTNRSASNCMTGLLEENCKDTNNYFIKSDPQCGGEEAKNYCSSDDSDDDGDGDDSSVGGNGGIVPCGGASDPCTLCHLIIGINNLVKYGLKVLLVFSLLGIFISGVIYLVSSGDPGLMQTAKSALTASLVGFAVALGAWLMINIVMNLLAKSDLGLSGKNWYTFTCSTQSSALTGGGDTPTAEDKKCCIKSTDKDNPDYGNKEKNCPDATPGKTKDQCKTDCDQNGTGKTPAEIQACKDACKDGEATCPEGQGNLGSCSDAACGGTVSVGCGKIVDAAKQWKAKNCQYCSKKENDPPGCNLNGCSGNPMFTDCSNLVDACYKAAGCNSPGSQSDAIGAKGKPIGSFSELKAGDVLWKSGHVAMCVSDGCGTVIHASGRKDDIKESGGSYPKTFSKVIPASCPSCN